MNSIMRKQNNKWFNLSGEYDLRTERDTIALAKLVASYLKAGDVIALYGELGAGKTFFTQQLCRFLGISEIVSSPSYVLINQYDGDIPVTHVDFYRLAAYEEVLELGLEEMLEDKITVIEWPEVAAEILPEDTLKIHFYFDGIKRKAIISKR